MVLFIKVELLKVYIYPSSSTEGNGVVIQLKSDDSVQ